MVANTISISLSEMISGCESHQRITAAAKSKCLRRSNPWRIRLPANPDK